MKKSLVAILIAIIAVFALGLTACAPTDNDPDNHTHNFMGEWHSDASGHQRECTGCDELSPKQNHSFVRGKCTECGFKDPSHTHDFNGEWHSDNDGHQRQCVGCDELDTKQDHTFARGKCTECGFKDPSHVHNFTGEWIIDNDGHQKECTGCDELSPKQDHTFANRHCTECGYTYEKGTDGLQFTLDDITQTYSVTGYTGTEQQVIIPPYHEDKKVTSIGIGAFNGCYSLRSIEIPDSVTSIGEDAFYDCYNLKEVHISDIESWLQIDFRWNSANPLSNEAKLYVGDKELTKLTIPQGITEIKKYAFDGCESLTSIVIPDSVTSIGDYAFDGCDKLVEVYNLSDLQIEQGFFDNGLVGSYALDIYTSLDAPSKIVEIEDYLFYDDNDIVYLLGYKGSSKELTIPKDYKGEDYDIYPYAFYDCKSLTSVTIPNSVTSIGYSAFKSCENIKEVRISDIESWFKIDFENYWSNPSYYGAKLYVGDNELTELTMPQGITEIKQYAFFGCTSLKSVTFPEGVTSIGDCAFSGCYNLQAVTFAKDSNLQSIGYSAFSGCDSLTSITIPDSVTGIGNFAFESCSSLTSITIPNSITSIGDYAFYGCENLKEVHISDIESWLQIDFGWYSANPLSNGAKLYVGGEELTELTIPQGITEIKQYAFYGFSSLTSVNIPNSVTSIESHAFDGCSRLTSVYYGGSSEEWNDISIVRYNNDYLTSADRYYFSEEDPYVAGTAKDGEEYWHYGDDGMPQVWAKPNA